MCGISGIYCFNQAQVNDGALRKMTEIIAHRGPDGFGYWYNADHNIGLGHRRLSIIDLSEAGKQPMHYLSLSITFNGEIYNYLEIKNELVKKGYTFSSGSDTEVLLALYHLKGVDCLQELDGMFSFAIWDEEKKELFCARDRFGEKPFFYYKDDKQFIFGSEIKQIIAAGIPKEVSRQMLYAYCHNDSLNDSNDLKRTFFNNIYQLPHSHYLLIKYNEALRIEKYWDIDQQRQTKNISFDNAVSEFSELLSESITRRLRSDVPLGTSLSGGLDSTTIASFICSHNHQKNLNTFTASFPGFEKDETKFIKILKQSYSNISDHYVMPQVDELSADLDRLLFHQDEPVGSTSIYAQFRVMGLARQNAVTVLLDGQGADEFLGGYNQFWSVRLREMYAANDSLYNAEKQHVKDLLGGEHNLDLNMKMMLRYPGLHKSLSGLKNALLKKKLQALSNPLRDDYYMPARPKENNVNWSSLNSVLYHSIFSDGLQHLLRYADRNSMAHSREVRLPFLSHKLVEFVFSMPSEYKMQEGWSKLLLRKSQEKILPKEIGWRKEKVGYATPQKSWMQDEKIQQIANDKRTKLQELNIFDKAFLNACDNWKIFNLYHLLS